MACALRLARHALRLAGHVARTCIMANVDGAAWCVGGLACWLKVVNHLVDQVFGVVVLVVCMLVVCVMCALRSVCCVAVLGPCWSCALRLRCVMCALCCWHVEIIPYRADRGWIEARCA